MEQLQLMDQSELGGNLVSFTTGDSILQDGIIFTQEAGPAEIIAPESNQEGIQNYIPVQMLQDSSFVVPLLVRNEDGNTFLVDPRQLGLVGLESTDETESHFIIGSGLEGSDNNQQMVTNISGMGLSGVDNVGNLVLSEPSLVSEAPAELNQPTFVQLGSHFLQGGNRVVSEGMCIDMSQLSIVSENGVVSYISTPSEADGTVTMTDSNTVTDGVTNNEKSDSKSDAIPAEVTSSKDGSFTIFKRRRGRPRKMVESLTDDIMEPPIGKPPYRCDSCGFEAALWSRLKRHKQSHKNEKPHRCKLCPVSFNDEANLSLHMATHNDGDLKCPECQRQFTRMASLRSHLLLHEREDNLFCTECGDEFALQYQLDSHMMEHQEEWVANNMERVYECQHCQRQFTRSSALKEHMREHVKVKHSLIHRKHNRHRDRTDFVHKCSYCNKVFQKPSQLVRHSRIHTGEKPFECAICAKAFNQKGSLHIHMAKHNGSKPHSCDFCNARFSQKGNLRAHIQRVHAIPQQGTTTYRCSECPCIFKKLGSLNSHMGRSHSVVDSNVKLSSEQMMQVNVDQIMAQLAALEKVTATPSRSGVSTNKKESQVVNSSVEIANIVSNNEKSVDNSKSVEGKGPVTAPASKDILQQAMNKSGLEGRLQTIAKKGENYDGIVTGFITLADKGSDGTVRRYTIRQRKVGRIKWHQCSYCCKEFKKPSDLVRHIRIHTHEKPYKCLHCFRAFSIKSTLTAHMRTHGGMKQHSCPVCEKKFSSTSSLKVHQRLHNGEKPFQCNICNKQFRTSGHRQAHWLTHCGDEAASLLGLRKKPLKIKKATDDSNLPDVLLQDPILITDSGLIPCVPGRSTTSNNSAPKPHQCDQCDYSFRKSSYLKIHQRVHSGERPSQCTICDKKFISNGVLKSHMHTHDTAKAFRCLTCRSVFSTKGSLKRHMDGHNGTNKFMCPYCRVVFKSKLTCKKHMKLHKPELARALVEQKDFGDKFVVAVGDDFNTGDIIIPEFRFSEGTLNSDEAESNTDGEAHKLVSSSGVITHTLLADATGTITLPSVADQHNLTQESIQEIEDTLNQQLSNRVSHDILVERSDSSALAITDDHSNVVPTIISFSATPIENASEAEILNPDLITNEKVVTSDGTEKEKSAAGPSSNSGLSDTLFGQPFEHQSYETGEFSAITLQGELAGLDQGTTLSANMEAILPQSRGRDRRGNVAVQSKDNNNVDDAELQEVNGEFVYRLEEHSEQEEDNVVQQPDDGQNAEEISNNLLCCQYCFENFKKHSLLREHIREAHGDVSSNVCIYCDRHFTTAAGLKAHIRKHTGERSYVCSHCNSTFASNGSLTRHLIVHSDNRPFECSKCASKFRTQLQLRKHSKSHGPAILRHVRTSRRNAAITLTEEETSALATQSVDMASSVSEKILIASALELNMSEEQESGRKPGVKQIHAHRCKYCPKSFRKPSDLVRHVRIHTGERPFRCMYCAKCFTVKSTLDSHQKIHTSGNSKLFPCHVCNVSFSTKGSLKVHMRIHTGYKPFKCQYCNLKFRTSGHRKAHQQSHLRNGTANATVRRAPKTPPPPQLEVQETPTEEQQSMLTQQVITEDGSVLAIDPTALLVTTDQLEGSHFQLQINESLLQQLQEAGNLVIQPNGTLALIPNGILEGMEEAGQNELREEEHPQNNIQELSALLNTMEDINSAKSVEDDSRDSNQQTENDNTEVTQNLSGMHFEIHTDEHGQIVNIQPSMDTSGGVLTDIEDLNISENQKVDLPSSCFQIYDETHSDNTTDGIAFKAKDNEEPKKTRKTKGKRRRLQRESSAGNNMHLCTVCGKVFRKPSQLERHVRIHTGERPFPCTLCWKAFNQKNALAAHMKRHTGERPFECPYCQHGFTQGGNLKTHIRRAHQFDVSNSGKKKVVLPKNILLDDVSDASLRLDLEKVVGDLFPQMRNSTETDVD